MVCKEKALIIPDGYKIIEREKTVDIDTAGVLLSTKKQNKFTSASRKGTTATLTWHSIKCPYCGNESLSYSHFLDTPKNHPARIPKDEIEKWSTRQLSLFDNQDKMLRLNKVYAPRGQYECPSCKAKLFEAKSERKIYIKQTKNSLSVSCEIMDVSELLSMTWLSSEAIQLDYRLYETLTFNFRNGHSFIKLENINGDIFAIRDITTDTSDLTGGVVYSFFSNSKKLNRILKNIFLKRCNGKIPFSLCELSLEKFVLLTRFVGYDRSFFDSIPFCDENQKIDSSFKAISNKLRFAYNVPDVFEKSELPNMKSVRKLFFNNPGLMFYHKEASMLWRCIGDPNLFCSLISCEYNYAILSDLHMCQGIFDFYSDYCKKKGAIALCRALNEKPLTVHSYALFYHALSDVQKRHERKKWINNDIFISIAEQLECNGSVKRIGDKYSIPIHSVEESIVNCVINGYSFVWLRNMMEYKRAGQVMNNCLSCWNWQDNPVVVVSKLSKLLAAIEVNGSQIKQARLKDNRQIEDDSELFGAFLKWKERNKLEYTPFYHGNRNNSGFPENN